jgi:hypothetical protein
MIFGFPHNSTWEHRIFEIFVPIPHNKGVIMVDRNNIFDALRSRFEENQLSSFEIIAFFFKQPVM